MWQYNPWSFVLKLLKTGTHRLGWVFWNAQATFRKSQQRNEMRKITLARLKTEHKKMKNTFWRPRVVTKLSDGSNRKQHNLQRGWDKISPLLRKRPSSKKGTAPPSLHNVLFFCCMRRGRRNKLKNMCSDAWMLWGCWWTCAWKSMSFRCTSVPELPFVWHAMALLESWSRVDARKETTDVCEGSEWTEGRGTVPFFGRRALP